MQCKDIPDHDVMEAAFHWDVGDTTLGVVETLMSRGIPEKVALRKVERLVERGRLEYGTSPYYAWPIEWSERRAQ